MLVQERAVILSKTKYGEADLILKLLTSTGEVFSAIAKSALKSKKRFGGGVLEPTHYVSVSLLRRGGQGDSERMVVINEAQMIDDFRGLKTDYDRLELAFHCVRAVSTVSREGDMHRDVFNLLGHTLKTAETASDLHLLKMQFNLKLLHLQGVLPPDDRYAPFLRMSVREGAPAGVTIDDMRSIGRDVTMIFENYVS